ncbi:hypothetical protein [Saccharothrix sp. NRRL B-16314]|uniref:hypothetical protein n=1 Tax=Saccharothrix sp. NRRL B-16314 TaxID=1463825 RepID=UPI000526EB56|nr:hypothetical protein [Saccharothrix sp. NRRL B-16314]
MTQPHITAEEVEELFAKLDEVQLNDPQRALLSAILKVAGDVTEVTGLSGAADDRPPDDRSFSDQFATAFTPHQAALVVEYAAAPQENLISRNNPPCPPVPPGSAQAAMISRRGTPSSSQP